MPGNRRAEYADVTGGGGLPVFVMVRGGGMASCVGFGAGGRGQIIGKIYSASS